MDKKKLWNIVKLLLKIAVTGVSLYFVFKKVDIKEIKAALSESNPLFLLLGLLFFILSQIIAASRLRTYFKGIRLNISALFNFKVYLLGMFYNLFLPGGIGGDGYKIFLLRKKFAIKKRRIFFAIFFDRFSGLWALGLITSALLIFIPHLGVPRWLPILATIICTGIYYLVMRRYFPDYSKQVVSTHTKAILVQSMQIICVLFLLSALHFEGKFAPYLFMFLISSLVAVFPFSVGGLGAREIVFIWGAPYLNLDQHIAVLISLLFYCISALVSLTGMYFVLHPKQLTERVRPSSSGVDFQEASGKKLPNPF